MAAACATIGVGLASLHCPPPSSTSGSSLRAAGSGPMPCSLAGRAPMPKPIINLAEVTLEPTSPMFAPGGSAAERFEAKTGVIAFSHRPRKGLKCLCTAICRLAAILTLKPAGAATASLTARPASPHTRRAAQDCAACRAAVRRKEPTDAGSVCAVAARCRYDPTWLGASPVQRRATFRCYLHATALSRRRAR